MPSALGARGAVFVQVASPEVMHGGCQKTCMETALDTCDPLWLPLEIPFFFKKKKEMAAAWWASFMESLPVNTSQGGRGSP